jgi:uncharacterized protein HemX
MMASSTKEDQSPDAPDALFSTSASSRGLLSLLRNWNNIQEHMNKNTSPKKTSSIALGLAVLVAVTAGTAAGIYFRHSQRLQVRLDITTKELQQTKSDLERAKSKSEKAASDLAATRSKAESMSELEITRLKLGAMMAAGLGNDHPAVRDLTRKISEFQK